MSNELKRTPLFEEYAKYGAKQLTSVDGNYLFNSLLLKKNMMQYVIVQAYLMYHIWERF